MNAVKKARRRAMMLKTGKGAAVARELKRLRLKGKEKQLFVELEERLRLKDAEIDGLKTDEEGVLELSAAHAAEHAKPYEQLEAEAEDRKRLAERDPDHQYHPNPNLAPERRGLIYNAPDNQ